MSNIMECPSCHYKGTATIYMPGSPMMEGLLWLLVIPGLIYSIWRRTKRRGICPVCSSEYEIRSPF